MKRNKRIFCSVLLLGVLLLNTPTGAVPVMINYQGLVESELMPFSGTGLFRFAIVNNAGTVQYWSNDGLNPPSAAISLPVTDGLFSCILGDTSITNMNELTVSIFENEPLYLRIWFDDQVNGSQLFSPDQQMDPSVFTIKAADADRLDRESGDYVLDQDYFTNITPEIENGLDNNDQPHNDGAFPGHISITGYVGIGTTSPQQLLHLFGDGEERGLRISFSNTYPALYGQITHAGGGGFRLNANAGGGWADMHLQTEGTTRMFIESGGNVGIGTGIETPGARFEVKSSGYTDGMQVKSSDNERLFRVRQNSNGSGTIYVFDGDDTATTAIGGQGNTYFNGGHVGIGTTEPGAPLEISGDGSAWNKGFIFLKNINNDAGLRFFDSTSQVRHHIFNDNAGGDRLRIAPQGDYGGGITLMQNGRVAVNGTSAVYDLDVNGRIRATVDYICPSADLAEKLPVHPLYRLDEQELDAVVNAMDISEGDRDIVRKYEEVSHMEPGTVVVLTAEGIAPCQMAYDTALAGVISTRPAVKMASEKTGQYVALAGSVPCLVVGPVQAGEMLTTSSVEGHAMAASHFTGGAMVGKAMEEFHGTSGVINIWIGGL